MKKDIPNLPASSKLQPPSGPVGPTIKGALNDRAFKINRESDKVFPQFLSFERELLIEEIVENVDYIGGFALQGNSFIGAGTNSKPAKITYKKDGIPFITAKSVQIQSHSPN